MRAIYYIKIFKIFLFYVKKIFKKVFKTNLTFLNINKTIKFKII
jgi:hypothetical protein